MRKSEQETEVTAGMEKGSFFVGFSTGGRIREYRRGSEKFYYDSFDERFISRGEYVDFRDRLARESLLNTRPPSG